MAEAALAAAQERKVFGEGEVTFPEESKEEVQQLFKEVLDGVAGNVKFGPWKATSGIMIPYYLNSSTNFIDPKVAPKITRLFVHYLRAWLPAPQAGQKYLICGPEVAGGMLVSQLACVDSPLDEVCDYVYVRKERKSSGTLQQLEGPEFITRRTPESPSVVGVWVDDCNSTGGSLVDGIKLMKKDYNIDVKYAMYLVDRTKDRANLPIEKQKLTDPAAAGVCIRAIYGLDTVDDQIPEDKKKVE